MRYEKAREWIVSLQREDASSLCFKAQYVVIEVSDLECKNDDAWLLFFQDFRSDDCVSRRPWRGEDGSIISVGLNVNCNLG